MARVSNTFAYRNGGSIKNIPIAICKFFEVRRQISWGFFVKGGSVGSRRVIGILPVFGGRFNIRGFVSECPNIGVDNIIIKANGLCV